MHSKKRIQEAIGKYLGRNKPAALPKRKNKKPEQEIRTSIKKWLDDNGFHVSIIESRATYNVYAKRFLRGDTIIGHSDISGCDKNGKGVFIEVKNKGKRSTLKQHQREFLTARIRARCFACCADSAAYVKELYYKWSQIGQTEQKRLLLAALPKEKKDDGELF